MDLNDHDLEKAIARASGDAGRTIDGGEGRRHLKLTVEVEIPEDWSDDDGAGEVFAVLALSEEKAMVPCGVAPQDRTYQFHPHEKS